MAYGSWDQMYAASRANNLLAQAVIRDYMDTSPQGRIARDVGPNDLASSSNVLRDYATGRLGECAVPITNPDGSELGRLQKVANFVRRRPNTTIADLSAINGNDLAADLESDITKLPGITRIMPDVVALMEAKAKAAGRNLPNTGDEQMLCDHALRAAHLHPRRKPGQSDASYQKQVDKFVTKEQKSLAEMARDPQQYKAKIDGLPTRPLIGGLQKSFRNWASNKNIEATKRYQENKQKWDYAHFQGNSHHAASVIKGIAPKEVLAAHETELAQQNKKAKSAAKQATQSRGKGEILSEQKLRNHDPKAEQKRKFKKDVKEERKGFIGKTKAALGIAGKGMKGAIFLGGACIVAGGVMAGGVPLITALAIGGGTMVGAVFVGKLAVKGAKALATKWYGKPEPDKLFQDLVERNRAIERDVPTVSLGTTPPTQQQNTSVHLDSLRDSRARSAASQGINNR